MLTLNENDFDYNLPSVAGSSRNAISYNINSIFSNSVQNMNELEGMIYVESASRLMQILGDYILFTIITVTIMKTKHA